MDTANGIRGYLVNANIASQDVASLNLSYPLQIRNYSLFTNVNTYYSSYRSDFGAGRRVDLDVWAVKVYAQNNYRFGKGWTAEVNGFYSSPSIWQGTMKSSHFWSVDAGLQKQVLKGEGTIKVSVSDVFKSQRWNGTSDFGGQHVYAAGSSDSRQLRIHFNYRFGNKGVKAARQFRSGVEDELNRTQSSGGLGH